MPDEIFTGGTDAALARGGAATDRDAASGDLAVSVLGRLFRLAPRLVELLDFGAREYGLGFARGRVLWELRESGPVLMRALSQALGVSPRTITGLVDALEADGWVTRGPHPTDRRATVISLTPTATAALAELDEGWRGLARTLLAGVPATELTHCRTIIGLIEERLDDAVVRAEPRMTAGYRSHAARATPAAPAPAGSSPATPTAGRPPAAQGRGLRPGPSGPGEPAAS